MRRYEKKWLIGATLGALASLLIVPPIFHLVRTAYRDRTVIERLPAGYADDVSRLNKTQIEKIWDIPSDPQQGEEELRELLLRAQASHLHVSVAGARHSMGGQTIYPGGTMTHSSTMPPRICSPLLCFSVSHVLRPEMPKLQNMKRELVDAVLDAGGRYYLPYRLHPTTAQFHRAYLQAERFFALRRRYDPGELFQNEFYQKYASIP